MNEVNFNIKVTKTDIGQRGHVDFPTYFKWFEEGHKKVLNKLNLFDQERHEKTFIRHLEIDYLKELFEGDKINISTKIIRVGKTSITYQQTIRRNKVLVNKAKIIVVLVDERGGAIEIPQEIREILNR